MLSDEVVTSAASANADEATEINGPAKNSLAETLDRLPQRPWKIPSDVERGYEIPIGIISTDAIPVLGDFKRLAMDIVVNATWLALVWAREDGNEEAASALKHLILQR